MKLNKANLAGLTSPGQESEMKSILAGTWPPLKPLPVFKYETAEYRATISFDKKRGEWVCRKTSLPSNEVQELRGGLLEITMALPHGETGIFPEGAEPQEPELEKDAHRRLQAIREWREKYESGARYFELRDFLSEGQRTELDDSLRLSLTARQLQFNPRNVADVFDDLSVAGGRFAALIEFAMRNKANRGIEVDGPGEGAVAEAERAPDNDKQPLGIILPESGATLGHDDSFVPPQEAIELCTGAEEFPALSIKNVFPEQELTPLAERAAHTANQQFGIGDFDIDSSEISDERSPSLAEHSHVEHSRAEHSHAELSHSELSHKEQRGSPVFTDFAAQVPAGKLFEDRAADSSSRFPALKISAFQANAFALLLLFAVTSFTVGLTVGRGPFGKRLREAPKSLLATDAKPPAPTLPDPAQPDAADESSSQAPNPPMASSDDSSGINRHADATPPEEKSKETPLGSENSADVRSRDSDLPPATESMPSVKPEVVKPPVSAERSGTIGPVARSVSPPASVNLVRPSSRLLRRPRAVRSMGRAPRSPYPYKLTSAIAATPHTASVPPHMPRSSTILVTVPDRGSQPFRVSFPNKTIAATSSLAMTSQLSVLVPPEPALAATPKSARLEAGELVSFGWPRYLSSGRNGAAETIRVRATIGQLGQVEDVKFLGGSASLLPATAEAIRQWRYTPTLLEKRPVQAQQDVTIEFRPSQYSARLSTPRPPLN